MNYNVSTPEDYILAMDEERRPAFEKLRETIIENIPDGFQESFGYGMIGYVVPHTLYPPGYHCDPKQALPFVGIAAQKQALTLYHMGLYAQDDLLNWFVEEYPKHSKRKLDMGKSCIRFKKADEIPYALIAELMQKMTVEDWVMVYEEKLKR
ncbi:MAG: DUF1801 domain-containing protein [Saprospiraceae bacterium]|nr:DUF1801 domain-containing protein [Saprospiraceae bacterium]